MGLMFPVSGVLLVLVVVGLLVLVIKKKWYSQGLLFVAFTGAVIAATMGIYKLQDANSDNDTTGAVLLGIGLVVLLATGISTRMLYFGHRGNDVKGKKDLA